MFYKRILIEHVITVDPSSEFAGCSLQSAVYCVALSAIRFANPIADPRRIFLNNFYSVIRATPVDYEIFEIRIALQQNRANGLLDESSLIEGGSDDA